MTTLSGNTTGRIVLGTPSLQALARMYDAAPFETKKTLWVNTRGEIVIDVSMVYLQGEAFVLLQVKHTIDTAAMQKYTTWVNEYIKVPRPRNKKARRELLRNMATMHAMKLGYPHKLRSKV